MSGRKKKEVRKGYRQAGHIYWTKEMERAIRGIHARAYVFGIMAAIEAVFILGFILKANGVL